MRDAVIVEAVRTPVGKRNGALSGVHPRPSSASPRSPGCTPPWSQATTR